MVVELKHCIPNVLDLSPNLRMDSIYSFLVLEEPNYSFVGVGLN